MAGLGAGYLWMIFHCTAKKYLRRIIILHTAQQSFCFRLQSRGAELRDGRAGLQITKILPHVIVHRLLIPGVPFPEHHALVIPLKSVNKTTDLIKSLGLEGSTAHGSSRHTQKLVSLDSETSVL
eukprot:2706855-Pyramimonas_sp.AAC.1